MSKDLIDEARKDLLSDLAPETRYPGLAARPDWPPSPYVTPAMLTEAEAREYDRYADEMSMREGLAAHGQPIRDEDRPVPDADGMPIPAAERDRGQESMLQDMHAEVDDGRDWYKQSTGRPLRDLGAGFVQGADTSRDGDASWYREAGEKPEWPAPDDRERSRTR